MPVSCETTPLQLKISYQLDYIFQYSTFANAYQCPLLSHTALSATLVATELYCDKW